MKRFRDLEFKEIYRSYRNHKAARLQFPNGYGVSVISGGPAYCSEGRPYELAVTVKGLTSDEHYLCYSTYVTDDVVGHLTKAAVTKLMIKIQDLPSLELQKALEDADITIDVTEDRLHLKGPLIHKTHDSYSYNGAYIEYKELRGLTVSEVVNWAKVKLGIDL